MARNGRRLFFVDAMNNRIYITMLSKEKELLFQALALFTLTKEPKRKCF